MYSGVKFVYEVIKIVFFIYNLDEWYVLLKFLRYFLVVYGWGFWVWIWYICWVVSGIYNGFLFKYLYICLVFGLLILIKLDGVFIYVSIFGFKLEFINIYN